MAKRVFAASLWVAMFSGCGGSGGSGGSGNAGDPMSSASPNLPQPAPQSPGGIWHAFPPQSVSPSPSPLSLFIAENGEMKVMASGPAFGSGAVIVTNDNRLSGSYQLRSIQSNPLAPTTPDTTCEIEGTVTARLQLRVTARCTDAGGVPSSVDYVLGYDTSYETDSTLADIAGNYTLSFSPATNSLNINSDGTVFGLFHNGVRCTVNGRVEIPDSRFNLYRFELGFSSCQTIARYEGQTMTGLAVRAPPGLPPGAFLLLLTGAIEGRLHVFSILYERA
jgi:hypothetical protein